MSKLHGVRAPLQAQIVAWLVAPGDRVRPGDVLVVLEAMKMEHEVRATEGGRVLARLFEVGESVEAHQELLRLTPLDVVDDAENALEAAKLDQGEAPVVRQDRQRWAARQALTLDAARPQAVAKRHALGL